MPLCKNTGEEHFSTSTIRYNRNYGDIAELTGNILNYSVAAPVVSVMSLPSTVMRSMHSPQIATPFTFYAPQNTNVLYDFYSGQKVAEMTENITLDPEILLGLGVIQIDRSAL